MRRAAPAKGLVPIIPVEAYHLTAMSQVWRYGGMEVRRFHEPQKKCYSEYKSSDAFLNKDIQI
jgi:hypothetical protein